MRIAVISAHPDDEALGCGGSLLRHKAEGAEILWLIVTKLSAATKLTNSKLTVAERAEQIVKVRSKFEFCDVIQLDFEPASLTYADLPRLIPQIANPISIFAPERIYFPFYNDSHSDHRVCAEAVFPLVKTFRLPTIKTALMYECLSETECAPAIPARAFSPQYYIDISKYLKKKIEIANIYSSEMGKHPFPRSERAIEALATLRGSVAGVEYAEAFEPIRIIE